MTIRRSRRLPASAASLAVIALIAAAVFFRSVFASGSVPDEPRSAGTAASPLEGRWVLEFDREDGRVQLTMLRGSSGHRSENSSEFALPEFRDLKRPSGSGDSPARFALVRDAGTFEFEGHLDVAGGAGKFRFAPSSEFART
jgi:hypothetical protein